MKFKKFFSILRITLFVLIIAVGCVAGFIIPLRPTVSESEGRTLTEFPEFTVESFLSGEYTTKLNLWYSDTFPTREELMSGNAALKSLYGIKTEDFAGKTDKDEIDLDQDFIWEDDTICGDFTEPLTDTEETEADTLEPGETSSEQTDESADTSDGSDSSESERFEDSTEPSEDPTEKPETPTSPPEKETEPPEKEVIDGYYVVGNTAHQLYYFNQDYVDRYTKSVMNAALKLDGIAQVYDMVVPTSPCFYLSDADIARLGCSDGNDAIAYIYKAIGAYSSQLQREGRLSSPVKTLDLYPYLARHKNEYIFFRTDHHWTGLGAYYASRFFLDSVGRSYPSLDKYTVHKIDGFLGTLYKNTQNINLKNNPDTVYAYESPTVKKLTVYDRNAQKYIEDLIINTNIKSSNKYLCFSSGDRPYYEIHNETINDGSAILVIRESYGNAFLPMIADSYEYVYAIDYRFWDEDLVSFVRDRNIDTVLFLNNLAATVTNYNIWTMERCVK